MRKTCFIFGVLLFILSGCQPEISESTAEGVIARYFASKSLRVIELKINSIEAVPLSKQQYMGTEGYIIHIDRIVLETRGGKKQASTVIPKTLSFHDARIGMKKSPAQNGADWIITGIEGIAVP